MSIPVPAFLALALGEIRASRGGDVVPAADQQLALDLLNELFDYLNSTDRMLYARTMLSETLVPNLQPHTIGPTGTFVVSQRPVSIMSPSVVLGSNIRVPIRLRDDQWWANQRAPLITASFPTDVYYEPSWPNGALTFWPVPTQALGFDVETTTLVANLTLGSDLDLPQGYQLALRLMLAEALAPQFGQQLSPSTLRRSMAAQQAVWGNNDRVRPLQTDGGLPHARRGGFNFYTGEIIR